MKYQIRFTEGELQGQVFSLGVNALSLGRSRSNEVKLQTPDVSAKHVTLSLGPAGVILENLSSRSTTIDGEAISMGERKTLVAGQTIGMGSLVKFTLEAMADAPAVPKTAPVNSDNDVTMPPPAAKPRPAPIAVPSDDDATVPPPAAVSHAPVSRNAAPSDDDATVPPPVVAKPATIAKAVEPADGDATVPPAASAPKKMPAPKAAPGKKAAPKPVPKPLSAEESAADAANETIAMQTRMASAEELEFMKSSHEKKKMRKTGLWFAVAVVFIGIFTGVYFAFFHKTTEKYVSWPVDDAGNMLAAVVQMENCPYLNDLDVKYPNVPGCEVKREAGKFTVNTALGKLCDVPLHLIFEYYQDKKVLTEERTTTLEAWMSKKTNGNENWNFDLIQPIAFYQSAHGIPYLCVPYSRTENNESYVGYAVQMRRADWVFVLMKEIPTRDRWRAEWFIQGSSFLRFSENFLMEHWEGTADFQKGQPSSIVAEAKSLLRRRSPTVWFKAEYLLRSALCQAQGAGDTDSVNEAVGFLKELRTSQIDYFNQQKINYLLAKNNKNDGEMKKISNDLRGVFSSEEDFRFHKIRQNKWD